MYLYIDAVGVEMQPCQAAEKGGEFLVADGRKLLGALCGHSWSAEHIESQETGQDDRMFKDRTPLG